MDRVFILGALSAGSLYLLHHNRKKMRNEAFTNTVPSITEQAFGPDFAKLVNSSLEKHNDLSRLTDPLIPPGVGVGAGSGQIRTAQELISQAINPVLVNEAGIIIPNTNRSSRTLNSVTPGGNAKNVTMCEAVKSIQSCDVFDNPAFAQTCGLCFQGGQNNKAEPHLGGLYVDEDAIEQAKFSGRKMMDRFIQYQPTVGKCDPGMFVVNKKQCERLTKKLKCEKEQNFDIPGCSQCLENEQFSYVDESVNTIDPHMIIVGKGKLSIFINGTAFTKTPLELGESRQKVDLDDIKESDRISLTVKGGNTSYLAGYITGTTASGEFAMDLNRLILVDTVTGTRPRIGGQVNVGTEPYLAMKPGKGKEDMNCEFVLPFTFLDPTEKEAISCPSGPYITKNTSAQFMKSGPCFLKGAGPGNYNQECILQIYQGSGCTEKGSGYPSTERKARELLTNEFGKTLTLSEIANRLYEMSIRAFTGRNSTGEKIDLADWDYASTFCLGIPRKTPCDVDNSESGPLPPECINYLYQNRGTTSHVGPTYNQTNITSLFPTDENLSQGCTPEGTIAPYNKKEMPNEDAIKKAMSIGGVKAVKDFYNQIHKQANDNSVSDEKRKDAIQQCYGIALKKKETNTKASLPVQLLQGSPVFVLGDYNMPPWNIPTSYPDKGANWIGGRAGADKNAPGTGFVNTRSGVTPGASFHYVFNNTSGADIPSVIYIAADNNAIVFMNDTQVYNGGGGWGNDWQNKKINYTFKSGITDIVILQTNAGGPEGLLFTAIGNKGNVLFHSDSSWKLLPEYTNVLDQNRVLHAEETYTAFDNNTIRSLGGNLCADVQGFNKADGSRVFSYPCNGVENQTWTMDGKGRLISADSQKCLRTGTSTNNSEKLPSGKAAVIGPCDDDVSAKWSYDKNSKQIRSAKYPGECLDINGGVISNASLIIHPCHKGLNQAWVAGPSQSNPSGTRVLVGPPINLSTVTPIVQNFGDMLQDYIFEFKLHILGKVPGWGAIFRFSATKNNYGNYGDRVLAGWLYPGSSQLHIRIGDPKASNWGCDSPAPLPMNRDVNIRIVARGANVKLYIDDVLVNQGNMPSGENARFTGNVVFAVPEDNKMNVQHDRPAAFMSGMTIR